MEVVGKSFAAEVILVLEVVANVAFCNYPQKVNWWVWVVTGDVAYL